MFPTPTPLPMGPAWGLGEFLGSHLPRLDLQDCGTISDYEFCEQLSITVSVHFWDVHEESPTDNSVLFPTAGEHDRLTQ